MQIEIKRTVKKEVEETVLMELIPYWVVRVIRVGGYDNKECIAEKEFDYEPQEQEIADTLADHINKKVFASVVKNYRFAEVKEQNSGKE